MTGLIQDAVYAARVLRRRPGNAALAALTVALGVTATTVLFSITYGVLLKPLPWPDADRLVRLYETRPGGTRRLPPLMTNLTYREWREKPATLENLAAWSPRTYTLADERGTERIRLTATTASLFPLLRARPLFGTLFGSDDERDDADQIVLSHAMWQQRFGSQAVLGRTVRLDGRPHRIVAVMPPSFPFPDRETPAWVPLYVPPVVTPGSEGRSLRLFNAIARLRPGVTPQQAAAEGTARGRGGPDAGPPEMAVFGTTAPVEISVVKALDAETAELRPALLVLLAAVGLLLTTAVANVASLQLARAVARRREVAIRSALGAGSGRLSRQLLVENVFVGLAGGAAGLLAAAWAHRALPWLLPSDFPRVEGIAIDARVAAFAIAVSIVSSLAFGLFPALYSRRVDVVSSLAEDGQAPSGGGTRTATARARALIIAGQVAIACVLLVGATLLARSFVALMNADRGYDPHNVLTARLLMPDFAFTPQRRAALVSEVLERLRAIPGVRHVGLSTSMPLTGREQLAAFPMTSPRGEGTITVQTGVRQVSPGYFAALGIRILEGRDFTDADTLTSPGAVVVNRSFARTYLSDTPLGDRLPSRVGKNEAGADVVGIIEDVRHRSVTDPAAPEIYFSYRQRPSSLAYDEVLLAIRTADDPVRLVPTLRALIREQDDSQALESVMTMEDRLSESLARPRLYAVLLSGFAVFALIIAAVGLFGVLAYSVAQRRREIGVRTALGARPRDVVALVARQALGMTVGGVAAGLAVSIVAVRYLGTFLYGVSAHDTATFVAVPCALVVIAIIACAAPARRAARIDPLQALRT